MRKERTCRLCNGSGELAFDPCWACRGTGLAVHVCRDCGEVLPGCRCVREYSKRVADGMRRERR